MKQLQQSIRSHVESHYPILYLVTSEEEKGDLLVEGLAGTDERRIYEWNMARGCVCFKTKRPLNDYLDLPSALDNWLDQELDRHFLIVKDAHLALHENPLAVVRLKALANRIIQDENTYGTVFLVSSQPFVPPELEKFITIFDPAPPKGDEIGQIIHEHAAEYGYRLEEGVVRRLAVAFRGMSEYEIGRLLNRGFQRDGAVGADDVELAIDEKRQIVKKSGILEMVSAAEGIDDIGGLEELKKWLNRKAAILADLTSAQRFGVDTPKGVMIVGMPGCGKSLTAKAASTLFGLPLLRLDVGSLMGKYVGESESNMRRALQLADAVSPCVLWVDEVEKAFAGIGGAGAETTSRLFGHFLTWLQEKTKPAFVVATANDIASLPPELLRKGRFDEVFYVDFPSKAERAEILDVHLRKRERQQRSIDINQLASDTEGFSGADLESVVKDAIERAFVFGEAELTTEYLRQSVAETVPLGRVMADKVEESRKKFSKMGIKRASPGRSDG